MSDSIRKRFCLRCSRRVKDDDIGAVELQRNEGVICGDDVDKLIANLVVNRDDRRLDSTPARLPVFRRREPEGTWL